MLRNLKGRSDEEVLKGQAVRSQKVYTLELCSWYENDGSRSLPILFAELFFPGRLSGTRL